MNIFKVFLMFIISVILPPLAVTIKRGASKTTFVNVVLTLLGWVPGVIHAWWVLSRPAEIRHPYMDQATGQSGRPSVWQYMA